ncbi:MAG: inorganic phosphate transporter [Clostridia bacterium]|nr:inorganic phosphate transporter [Clostridia bacterium]
MSFTSWITAVFSSFPLALLTILTLAVIFVNGWTDAPNAISSCVATRALSPGAAVGMAAVFNFLGLILTVSLNRTVTDTVYSMVDFGDNAELSRLALCAGMVAVVLWAAVAWYFGIPTSESHALIAGITGAAIAINGGDGVRFSVWSRVLWGLLISVLLGFGLGWLSVRLIFFVFRRKNRRDSERFFRKAEILGGAANAFLHGSQDGQKFIGVLLLSVAASGNTSPPKEIPLWMILLCSGVLSFGTCLGGGRIIRAVGMKMLKTEGYQGVSADLASAVSLGFCTLYGLPVSTTHVKTTALMGAGASVRLRSVNWSVAGQMILAWVFTFPGCGLLGYCSVKLLLLLL